MNFVEQKRNQLLKQVDEDMQFFIDFTNQTLSLIEDSSFKISNESEYFANILKIFK